MTTLTYAPMLALAIFLIAAIGVFAFIILRRGKLRRVQSSLVGADKPTRDWLRREADNAVDYRSGGHPTK